MSKAANILGAILIAAAALAITYFLGKRSGERGAVTRTVTVTDTVWVEKHDTAFIVKETRTVRHDTVLLALADTTFIHDSVLVQVPIEEKEFTGENYRIITEGYRTRLKDVWIYTPMVTNTVTNTVTKTRHWTGGVGVQIGYGYTTGGMSPYAGIGVSFGYVF